MSNYLKGSDLETPINKNRRELIPADKFVLKQRTMLGRLDGLRGMTWAYAVLYHTGLTASTASKKFTPREHPLPVDKNGNTAISNIMYQYLNGKRSPTIGPRGKLCFDLVGEIDKDPEGSLATAWLTHPLWDILHPDIDIRKIREYLFELPEELKNLAFTARAKEPMFDRVSDSRRLLDRLYAIGTIDAYAITIAVLRESELIGDSVLNECAWIMLKMWQQVIFSHPILQYVYHPLQHFLSTFIGSKIIRPRKEITEEEALLIDRPRTWKRVGKFGMLVASDEEEHPFRSNDKFDFWDHVSSPTLK